MDVTRIQVHDVIHRNANKVHLFIYFFNIYLWRITLGIDTLVELSAWVYRRRLT